MMAASGRVSTFVCRGDSGRTANKEGEEDETRVVLRLVCGRQVGHAGLSSEAHVQKLHASGWHGLSGQ
jgi:hypothetical protein